MKHSRLPTRLVKWLGSAQQQELMANRDGDVMHDTRNHTWHSVATQRDGSHRFRS